MKDYNIDENMQTILTDYVTKYEFRKAMDRIDARFDEISGIFDTKINKQISDSTDDYKRYIGVLSEEFQHRLSVVVEMTLSNREEIIKVKELLNLN